MNNLQSVKVLSIYKYAELNDFTVLICQTRELDKLSLFIIPDWATSLKLNFAETKLFGMETTAMEVTCQDELIIGVYLAITPKDYEGDIFMLYENIVSILEK